MTSSSSSTPNTFEPPLFVEMTRLIRPFWPVAAFATAMGIVSGLSTACLLATVNAALHVEAQRLPSVLIRFGGLCLLVLASESIAAVGNSIVGQRVIAALRLQIAAKVVCAPIAAIQHYRAHRLLATLHHDVDTVSAFTFNISGFAVAFAVTIGCLAYLTILSPSLFALVALAIAIGVVLNYAAGRIWSKNYDGVRDAEDTLQKSYSAITEGAKELRMNRGRRLRVYRNELGGAVDRIRDLKIGAMRVFWAAQAAGGVLFFVAIGAIVALGQWLGVSASVVSAFALVLLFVKGPLEQVVGALPGLVQAQIAFRRIAALSASFATPEPCLVIGEGKEPLLTRLRSLELRGVRYEFPATASAPAFVLGPLDLKVGEGELLFITGENGGGKTTLLMLLLGLYEPSSGVLLLDGTPVEASGRDDYRQLFSTVFFDYALFEDHVASGVSEDAARAYLERLEIAHKVRFENGILSTTDLSAGQRKRLALVQAYLENRPVLVFDEWAAEQDPTFRRIFYTEILPDLKRQGKTLIVISHDDRYFQLADRRITLRDGRIVSEEEPARFRSTGAA